MSPESRLASLADAALETAADASACEVVVTRTAGGVTRFAGSQVHQSVDTEECAVSVRAVLDDGRAGVSQVVCDEPAGAAVASRRALALARAAPPDPLFAGVARPAACGPGWHDGATASATPADRAAAAKQALAEAGSLSAAGSVSTTLTDRCVRTSAGADLRAAGTEAQLLVVLTGTSASGFATEGSHALSEIDVPAATGRAVSKVRAGADPGPIAAGDWPVVLEPPAVGSLVQFLAYLGFNAKFVAEGRSFASGRLGEPLLDPALTLVDDAADAQARGLPFDFEGTPKQRVELIGGGTLAGVAHDRRTAAAAGTASTGHALPPPNPIGPVPRDPFLVPGDGGSVGDLVASMERGLLVTRLHYVNVVHPKETVLTGMTRDGTFLVEDGEVVRPVRNLRFTQSVIDALAEVGGISSDTGYATELLAGGTRQPALSLPRFRFTGLTDFG